MIYTKKLQVDKLDIIVRYLHFKEENEIECLSVDVLQKNKNNLIFDENYIEQMLIRTVL